MLATRSRQTLQVSQQKMKYLLPSLGLVMVMTITIVTGYKPMDGTDVLKVLLMAEAQYDTAEEMASKNMISCYIYKLLYYTLSSCTSHQLHHYYSLVPRPPTHPGANIMQIYF